MLITNITRAMLPNHVATAALRVTCGGRACQAVVETYGQIAAGTTVALFGSNNQLKIAVTNGNAAQTLGCGTGDRVQVTWPETANRRP